MNKYKITPRRRPQNKRPPLRYAENERIKAGIAADPDTHEVSSEEFKLMKPYVPPKLRRLKYRRPLTR